MGISLGRRELVGDGVAYLNWAERKAQEMAAARAGLPPWQGKKNSQGFTVQPFRAHRQLLVVYRLVFKNVATQEAFHGGRHR